MTDDHRLPGDPLDEPIQRIALLAGGILEVRLHSGTIIRVERASFNAFLKTARRLTADTTFSRIQPQYVVNSVVGYGDAGDRRYGHVQSIRSTAQKGVLVHITMLDPEPLFGIERVIDASDIRSVMTAAAWERWHQRRLPGQTGPVHITPYRPQPPPRRRVFGTGKTRTGNISLIVRGEQTGARTRGKIYLHKTAAEIHAIASALRANGVKDHQIFILSETGSPLATAFTRFFNETSIGQIAREVLRVIHPHFRSRRCINRRGNPKKIYPTRTAAEAAITRIEPEPGKTISAYRCRHHGWHIGNN